MRGESVLKATRGHMITVSHSDVSSSLLPSVGGAGGQRPPPDLRELGGLSDSGLRRGVALCVRAHHNVKHRATIIHSPINTLTSFSLICQLFPEYRTRINTAPFVQVAFSFSSTHKIEIKIKYTIIFKTQHGLIC